MKKLLKKLIKTRLRIDLRDNCPLVAVYFCGYFIEAAKYNPRTKMFEEIKKQDYFYQL